MTDANVPMIVEAHLRHNPVAGVHSRRDAEGLCIWRGGYGRREELHIGAEQDLAAAYDALHEWLAEAAAEAERPKGSERAMDTAPTENSSHSSTWDGWWGDQIAKLGQP